MTKKIIAVDIDEVLLPHVQGLMDWYNSIYGTSLTLAHNRTSDFPAWGVTSREEAIKRVHGYFETPEFLHEMPFEEAITGIKKLALRYECIVITGRDVMIEAVTHQWLKRHFAGLFSNVHFTAEYSLAGDTRSKTTIGQAVGADYLIDDSLEIVLEASEAGIEGVLFGNYPWNQATNLPNNVTRCEDWTAVLEYFDGR